MRFCALQIGGFRRQHPPVNEKGLMFGTEHPTEEEEEEEEVCAQLIMRAGLGLGLASSLGLPSACM